MRKIPTLFLRDFEGSKGRYVTDELTPGLEWVLAGEGVATRKYDGTCVMFDGVRWWARREVKDSKPAPPEFIPEEHDPLTNKTVGWEPVENSGFAKFFDEAHTNLIDADEIEPPAGTYELCGPKIQANPEGFDKHVLVSHQFAERLEAVPWNDALSFASEKGWEGIVWHHPDGRMAKLKVKDFPA